ncbi:UvrD-helicase domain-containing protein [Oscillibacter ruminantium]|uniref:UvrD-helicase domain-containing protein n=1 Tax=Oscillibacter ruminantium TaxID=1263547 RepID=UPI00031224ED|nr:UvrD-helicase domain-containing protein [Oscillibacter ruminantium]
MPDIVIVLLISSVIIGGCIYYYKIYQLKKDPVVILELERIESFFNKIDILKKDYFTKPAEEELLKTYKETFDFFSTSPRTKLKLSRLDEFKETFLSLSSYVKKWNELYIENELDKNKALLDNIDGKSLDEQQRRAVVVDEVNNLVLAGAGSGKTLTISGKVKYLVDVKGVLPQEILLISFTAKAAEEMNQRITKKLKIQVESKTFHKLGLEIITKNRGKRYDVVEDDFLSQLIDKYFSEHLMGDKKQIQNIINFFGYYLNIPKDWEEFDSLGDCYDYYRTVDFETIKGKLENNKEEVESLADSLKVNRQTLHGETVKSLEEVIIANFLFLNGINYEYEAKYPYESPDKYRKSYRPDFYLPDFDIYIEHFGITKDNKTPWLSKIEEEKYIDDMRWKQGFHKQNNTTLIETYSYYNREGRLLSELEEKLKAVNVEFKEVDFFEIYKQIFFQKKNKYLTEFKKLISSFINLYKSNGYSLQAFDSLHKQVIGINNLFLRDRSLIFLDIVEPIYKLYQEKLQQSERIDFNDMINLATEVVKDGKGEFSYKYIIIDEYQDISLSRFNLIREIKKRTDAKLVCVGDDWQSIYRFAGSDIDLFTNFGQAVGYYELLKIEKTYRNSQELINIAGKLVMKNPKQLKKDLKSDKHHSNPIRVIGYNKDLCPAIMKAIDEIVYNFGEDAELTILGRNNFDIDFLEESQEFELKKTKSQKVIKYLAYPELKITYLTAHRSKGLEADNVIIINLENKLVGFPNKISDDPILSLVLTDLDTFAFAEERRLFYVALTRTKNTTYLLAPDEKKSVFVEELIKDFGIKYETLSEQQTVTDNPNCPKCKKGHLVVRTNETAGNSFLGCSNFPACDCTLSDIKILNDQIVCPVCGGYMTKRKGPYGPFYGCTNFPSCKNTLKIE